MFLQSTKQLTTVSFAFLFSFSSINLSASFHELGLRRDLLSSLSNIGLTSTTAIQEKSLNHLLAKEESSYILASHTGSGKTLAFMLPLIQQLKNEEENGINTLPNRPRALILAPTRELTEQIYNVAKILTSKAKLRLSLINSGKNRAAQSTLLNKVNDLIIASPNALRFNQNTSSLFYGDVRIVVIDEADRMLEETFRQDTVNVIKICSSKTKPSRFIFVSATLDKSTHELIDKLIPDVKKVSTSTLHKSVCGTIHRFKSLTSCDDKITRLFDILEPDLKIGKNVLIFCNTIQSCRAVDYAIRDRGIQGSQYHGKIPAKDRRKNFQHFLNLLEPKKHNSNAPHSSEARNGAVMVCSDIAARGLDFKSCIDHVINFDFPRSSHDYMHRSGRTARARSKGQVTSLITKADRLLASKIKTAIKNGSQLDQQDLPTREYN